MKILQITVEMVICALDISIARQAIYLVNGTWNKTVDVFIGSKDLGECCAEGWSRLNCRERHLPDVVTVTETKDPLGLVHSYTLLNL